MRYFKLLFLATTASCAFGAVGTTAVSAEEPAILCLVAGCGALEVKATGSTFRLEDTNGNSLKGAEVASTLKGCEVIAGSGEKDINLCKDILVALKGVENDAGAKCKTGTAANGTVEASLDLHIAAEKNVTKELEPLLLALFLSGELKKELTITCALVKDVVRGALGCLLLPGLKNLFPADALNVHCLIKERGKPLTGECEILCQWLTEEPFEAKLKETFVPAWMELLLTGKPSKDIFVTD
jgi:hypothetical protein